MRHRLPRSARFALLAVKASLIGAIAVTGWATQTAATGPSGEYTGYPVGDPPSQVERLLEKHDCSVTGFESEQPRSAIVQTAAGHLRFTSFDDGWRVYTAHGAARLVALCLDEPPARQG
ncbi:hypothetical protein [Nocardioides aquiterrae]|uniref:Secreted protein n=1 Tax=Nocardioides aquiterrae TaxID=203799 RepID=A0ABN1UH65_9ACTN